MERLFTDDVWDEAFHRFIESIYNISGSVHSRDRYERILRLFFADPARDPQSYTRAEVEAFLARPSTSGRNYGKQLATGTTNQRLSLIHITEPTRLQLI
jgi:hypothetical protein